MPFFRKYNTAATVDGVPLITRGAMDLKANPTLAAGDVTISKDGGAFANLTTLPTVTPAAGTSVQVALSATELLCARAIVRFIDQTAPKEWEDQEIIIETFGNASAQLPFDLGTASVAQTGDSYARLGAPAGASVSADIATKLATSGYTAPDNTTIGTINSKLGTPAGASVSADVAAVKGDTGGLRTDYTTVRAGKLDNLDAAISSRSTFAGGAVASVTAAVTVGGYSAGQDPATLIDADIIEGTITRKQLAMATLAYIAGATAGGGTGSIYFKSQAGTKNRISGSADSNGNRSAVTFDFT